MKEYITGAELCDMIICAADALDRNKQSINELNVFPVPDGDTGTNMFLTMATAAGDFRKKKPAGVSESADKAANAMLRGARGNSGVILSLLFRGISKSLKGFDKAYAPEFAAAMFEGVEAAYKAVMKPAEGTILTVSRMASAAAQRTAQAGDDFEGMLATAIEAAQEALIQTTEQNPVLKRAGVIDAGGKGYVIILEAMLAYLEGRVTPGEASSYEQENEEAGRSAFEVFDSSEITFAYDTVFIVTRSAEDQQKPLDLLRAYLDSIGDSLVISEGDDMFKVHVHTNTPGDALNEAQKYGTLETAKIENMRSQHDELVDHDDGDEDEPEEKGPIVTAEPEKRYGFVSVCAGAGMAELFRELGADRIVTGGQTMNPSTEDILREIEQTPSETVFVFPNNKNIIMAAQQCIPISSKRVVVVPTKTVPEGVSAMLNLDTYAEESDIVETFERVIANVHTALVTYAARDSEFDGHSIRAGEYLGLLDGALAENCADETRLFDALCDALEEISPEFISVYYGIDVDEAHAQKAAGIIARRFPDAELSVMSGGQPVYYFMISAE